MKSLSAQIILLFVTAVFATLPGMGHAQSSSSSESMEILRSRLVQSLEVASRNQLQVLGVKATAMEGIYEVELSTGELLYSDASGEFLFAGDLFQASPAGLVNLSEQTRQVRTKEKIAAIPTDEMIIFSPADKKATITVFTDVDCQYCRALHRDMEKLLEFGVEVRYLAYPRGGERAGSFAKMNSVWCSNDRKRSLTQAKNGQNIPEFECENPILEHYALGNEIGISGTPAIVLPSGQVVPGYMDSENLAALLEI